MRRKFKITFEVDAHYPHVEKHLKRMEKDFDQWIKDWTQGHELLVPILFEPNKNGAIEHQPNATVRVKVVRDKETILDTWWDELSDDF